MKLSHSAVAVFLLSVGGAHAFSAQKTPSSFALHTTRATAGPAPASGALRMVASTELVNGEVKPRKKTKKVRDQYNSLGYPCAARLA
jgi:hypothetical protein